MRKGAAAEGMTVRDYVWRGHDPTSVAVMTEVKVVALNIINQATCIGLIL